MKKYLLLLWILILTIQLYAQLEVKDDSFKKVDGFVNINPSIQFDDNDVPYAVVKVRTKNINDKQRHELVFEGNAATFIELEYKVGEVWVYLSSRPATYLKISHADMSSTEFWFPFDLEPKQGYELILVNSYYRPIDQYGNDKTVTKIIGDDYAIRISSDFDELYIDNQYICMYPLDDKFAYDHKLSCKYEDSILVFKKMAFEGNPYAQNNLGACYYKGVGVDKNQEQAYKWFKEAAEQGNAIGQINLAYCYFYGHGVAKDSLESLKWCKKSLDQGLVCAENMYGSRFCDDMEGSINWWSKAASDNYPVAQYNLAGYYHSIGDYIEEIKYLKQSSKQNYIAAYYALGLCYLKGEGVKEDQSEALKLIQYAANNGYDLAETRLGYSYFYGDIVAKDYYEAYRWFLKAAKKNHAGAQSFLGLCYENGYGVDKDINEAYKWYYKSAVQDNARAQTNLGSCYYWGKGVERNYNQAIRWYRKSADQDYAQGEYMLGVCYYYSNGTPTNYKEAFKWLEKAAKQNHNGALNLLGYMYEHALGVKKDYKKAFECYLKAAETGLDVAQHNVAWCYEFGKGVVKNKQEAIKWYKKAAEQGYEASKENLRDLGIYSY